jgi:epoxyqueuosine reductase
MPSTAKLMILSPLHWIESPGRTMQSLAPAFARACRGADNEDMPALAEIKALVKTAAAEAGFELAGVASARAQDLPELEHFPAWVAAGRAGEMEYLKARDEQGRLKRAALEHAAPWARSVIVCAINYNSDRPYSTEVRDPQCGWVARYAWTRRDYHDAVLARLRQVETKLRAACGGDLQTRCYVDTGPVVERVFAKYAGLGWLGKNTCLLNQEQGSWLFLGVILTSLELAPDLPESDHCGTCTACLDACPTGALIAPYEMDSRRCISYLTIEKRGSMPEEWRAEIGHHVFGCDICQDVCPWNARERAAPAPLGRAPELAPRPELVHPRLQWLAEMGEEEFRSVFRGSPLKRARRSGLRRNAVVAMGNSGDARFLPLLRKLAGDEDAVVAEHARWARARLEKTAPRGATFSPWGDSSRKG